MLRGQGYRSLEGIFGFLDIKPIAKGTYERYKLHIISVANEVVTQHLNKSVTVIRKYYEEELHRLPEDDGILNIDVSFDAPSSSPTNFSTTNPTSLTPLISPLPPYTPPNSTSTTPHPSQPYLYNPTPLPTPPLPPHTPPTLPLQPHTPPNPTSTTPTKPLLTPPLLPTPPLPPNTTTNITSTNPPLLPTPPLPSHTTTNTHPSQHYFYHPILYPTPPLTPHTPLIPTSTTQHPSQPHLYHPSQHHLYLSPQTPPTSHPPYPLRSVLCSYRSS
ncbi:hypothetical protein Pcinc_004490 [Petrolisthes cinctipes]|uniref:Uncharacterized protein n=1 Tax=Petrolisthes cinctipes TaxID=88211 RepID=A0AAE1GEG6_PETCI|nr:hypothetical protein Pcinc_004490 [Petrolisthes cinctipes]